MSLPPINPDTTASGIALDPRTQERVVPESRRRDGSVRKELKIRPGFTPQEDVTRFRGSKQQQMDQNALPKGHILGWVAPSAVTKPASKSPEGGPMSKSAKKNANRSKKKREALEKAIQASWEDSEDDESSPSAATKLSSDKAKQEQPSTKPNTDVKPGNDGDLEEMTMSMAGTTLKDQ